MEINNDKKIISSMSQQSTSLQKKVLFKSPRNKRTERAIRSNIICSTPVNIIRKSLFGDGNQQMSPISANTSSKKEKVEIGDKKEAEQDVQGLYNFPLVRNITRLKMIICDSEEEILMKNTRRQKKPNNENIKNNKLLNISKANPEILNDFHVKTSDYYSEIEGQNENKLKNINNKVISIKLFDIATINNTENTKNCRTRSKNILKETSRNKIDSINNIIDVRRSERKRMSPMKYWTSQENPSQEENKFKKPTLVRKMSQKSEVKLKSNNPEINEIQLKSTTTQKNQKTNKKRKNNKNFSVFNVPNTNEEDFNQEENKLKKLDLVKKTSQNSAIKFKNEVIEKTPSNKTNNKEFSVRTSDYNTEIKKIFENSYKISNTSDEDINQEENKLKKSVLVKKTSQKSTVKLKIPNNKINNELIETEINKIQPKTTTAETEEQENDKSNQKNPKNNKKSKNNKNFSVSEIEKHSENSNKISCTSREDTNQEENKLKKSVLVRKASQKSAVKLKNEVLEKTPNNKTNNKELPVKNSDYNTEIEKIYVNEEEYKFKKPVLVRKTSQKSALKLKIPNNKINNELLEPEINKIQPETTTVETEEQENDKFKRKNPKNNKNFSVFNVPNTKMELKELLNDSKNKFQYNTDIEKIYENSNKINSSSEEDIIKEKNKFKKPDLVKKTSQNKTNKEFLVILDDQKNENIEQIKSAGASKNEIEINSSKFRKQKKNNTKVFTAGKFRKSLILEKKLASPKKSFKKSVSQSSYTTEEENDVPRDTLLLNNDTNDNNGLKRRAETNSFNESKKIKLLSQEYSFRNMARLADISPARAGGLADVQINGKRCLLGCFGKFPRECNKNKQNPDVSVGLSINNEYITTGILEIEPAGRKKYEYAKKVDLLFLVLQGTAEIGIGNSSQVLRLGQDFYVPKDTPYYILNISNTDKVLLYFSKLGSK